MKYSVRSSIVVVVSLAAYGAFAGCLIDAAPTFGKACVSDRDCAGAYICEETATFERVCVPGERAIEPESSDAGSEPEEVEPAVTPLPEPIEPTPIPEPFPGGEPPVCPPGFIFDATRQCTRVARLPDLPDARSGHVAAVVDNQVLIAGGISADGDPSAAQTYIVEGDLVQSGVRLPSPTFNGAGVVISEGVVLLGGLDLASGSVRADAWLVDIGLQDVVPIGQLPEARFGHRVLKFEGPDVFVVVGGSNGASSLESALVFDFETATVVPTPPMGILPSVVQVRDGRYLVIRGGEAAQEGDVYLVDRDGSVTPAPGPPVEVISPGMVTLEDDSILIAGGGYEGTNTRAELWRYYYEEGAWVEAGELQSAREGCVLARDAVNRILVIGGRAAGQRGGAISTIEALTPNGDGVTFSSRVVATLAVARTPTVSRLDNGDLVLVGGNQSSFGPSAVVERIEVVLPE